MGTYIVTYCDECACLLSQVPANMGMRSARKEAREEGAIQVKVDGWNAVVCSEKCLAALKARYRRSK